MPDLLPSQAVALWFTYLRELQADCINTNASKMDLLTFANTKILTALPTTAEQNAFIVAAKGAPGFDLSTSQLSTYATFEALLDHFNPLTTYVGVLLQSLAASPFPSGAAADFWKASIATAFPGGSNGAPWQAAMQALASVIPAVCFTAGFQTKVNSTVDAANSKMSDVITQIAVLG